MVVLYLMVHAVRMMVYVTLPQAVSHETVVSSACFCNYDFQVGDVPTEIASAIVTMKDKSIFCAALFALKLIHYTFPKGLFLSNYL